MERPNSSIGCLICILPSCVPFQKGHYWKFISSNRNITSCRKTANTPHALDFTLRKEISLRMNGICNTPRRTAGGLAETVRRLNKGVIAIPETAAVTGLARVGLGSHRMITHVSLSSTRRGLGCHVNIQNRKNNK